jgi:hypothetical protein
MITQVGDLDAYSFLGVGILLTLALRGNDITYIATERIGIEATRAMYHRLVRRALGGRYDVIRSLRDNISNIHLFPRHAERDHDSFCKDALGPRRGSHTRRTPYHQQAAQMYG